MKTCLLSLLAQTARLQVLLVVPRGKWRRGGAYPSSIPPWLSRMAKQSKVLKVVRSKDYGPGTALLKATKIIRNPKTWLLAVDDDHAYHEELLTNLLRFAAGTPGAAVGAHGWLALSDKDATQALSAVGPSLARNLRREDVPGGPILCHFLGLLLQRAMLDGLEAPARGSPCSEHNDIWLSAHLAHFRIRRAMISDPLGAKDLATHRKRGTSLSRRRRRKPEDLCLKEYWKTYGETLWMPSPRVAICSLETSSILEELSMKGQVLHASYSCDFAHQLPSRRGSTDSRPVLASLAWDENVMLHDASLIPTINTQLQAGLVWTTCR